MIIVLLRLAYRGVTDTLALLRLLPMRDRDEGPEILALCHQITVLQRQPHSEKVPFTQADRTWLAAPLRRPPKGRPAQPTAAGPPRDRALLAP
ncbi:hypothetical protein GCM10027290_54170 [Micromonospora sonneratiae]